MNFCSREALAGHGALPGTGVRGRAYVFLPVPKRFWRANELNAGWASPEEIAAIGAARREGVVTRLYNPPAAGEAEILVRTAEAAPQARLRTLLAAFAGRWPLEAEPEPLLAVCTHGTRDRCCAKWGYAAFRAARRLYETGTSPFRPIECSHLGGDRFAATGIVFPSGSMYAHLDAADLPRLLACEAAGELWPQGYRGRVYEPALAQIVRAGLAAAGLARRAAGVIQVGELQADGERGRVLARTGPHVFTLELRREEVRFFGSCEDLARGRRSRVRRWTVENIYPDEKA